jgi:hypothetical protein
LRELAGLVIKDRKITNVHDVLRSVGDLLGSDQVFFSHVREDTSFNRVDDAVFVAGIKVQAAQRGQKINSGWRTANDLLSSFHCEISLFNINERHSECAESSHQMTCVGWAGSKPNVQVFRETGAGMVDYRLTTHDQVFNFRLV